MVSYKVCLWDYNKPNAPWPIWRNVRAAQFAGKIMPVIVTFFCSHRSLLSITWIIKFYLYMYMQIYIYQCETTFAELSFKDICINHMNNVMILRPICWIVLMVHLFEYLKQTFRILWCWMFWCIHHAQLRTVLELSKLLR